MSWGPNYMYYHCPSCGKKFKVQQDMIPELGDDFGRCPECGEMGVFEHDGAISLDDKEYFEIE